MVSDLINRVNLPPKKLRYFFIGVGLLICFLLTAFLETKLIVAQFDPGITLKLQQVVPRFLDLPLSVFSLLGGIEITSIAVLLIFALIYKKEKILLFSLCLFALVMIFEYIAKILIYHPNPPRNVLRYALPFSVPSYVSSHYSFPSGHVGRTIFLAVVILILIKKFVTKPWIQFVLRVFLLVFAFIMIISRISLGEHWASDVLGGLLLGAAMGFFAMVYYE